MEVANIKFVAYGLIVITFLLMIAGCTNDVENNKKVNDSFITSLNEGAVIKNEGGNYNLYNYENSSFVRVQSNEIITSYNKKSSVYIKYDNDGNYVVYGDKKIKINDDYCEGLKLSPDGRYFSYFANDNGLKLKLYDIFNNEELKLNRNVLISGTLYDWYDNNQIVYYGINNEKVNGVFLYNINSKEEKNILKINDGFFSFIKCTKSKIILLKINNDNKKELLVYDKNSKSIDYSSPDIENIYDVKENGMDIYFTGKIKDNTESLYFMNASQLKRVIYDFPSIVKSEKGLRIDKEGNVLFIGCDNMDSKEKIYRYGKDKSVEIISDESVEYMFVEEN